MLGFVGVLSHWPQEEPDEPYGSFAYGLAVVAFWDGLSSFGLQKAITRFVPIYHERGDHAKVRGAILLVLVAIAFTSALAIGTVFLAPGLISRMVSEKGPLDLLMILIFVVPVEAIDELLVGLFACFARPRAIFFRKHVLAPMLKLSVVILLVLMHADAQFLAKGYLTASVVGVTIYSVMFWRLFRREGLFDTRGTGGFEIPVRSMFVFTLPLLTSNLVPVVIHASATMILGYFHPTTEVARYRAVLPAAMLNNIVLASFGTYTCINWLRSHPYVRAWGDKYASQGLVLVGVQTPEFEFEGDLYGEWVRLEWVERLRDVERFPSVEALKEQLQRDRTRARAVLAAARPDPSVSHA